MLQYTERTCRAPIELINMKEKYLLHGKGKWWSIHCIFFRCALRLLNAGMVANCSSYSWFTALSLVPQFCRLLTKYFQTGPLTFLTVNPSLQVSWVLNCHHYLVELFAHFSLTYISVFNQWRWCCGTLVLIVFISALQRKREAVLFCFPKLNIFILFFSNVFFPFFLYNYLLTDLELMFVLPVLSPACCWPIQPPRPLTYADFWLSILQHW